jgi:hypothetical protein
MTDTTARRLADGILVAAALGAAYYVATTPRLRRMAAGLAATMVTSTLPAWLSAEVRRAWAESERPTFDEAPAGRPISATAPLGEAI